jgi:2-dehydropantoate 2-reductase
MKFVILGAGAIGAYAGAALARGGSDVTLIARGEQLRAIQQNGVQVLSRRGDFVERPPATGEYDALADADVVFIGLKAYSLPAFAAQFNALLSPDADVIPAQNGIPWWYFQLDDGPYRDTAIQSVDPDGALAKAIDAQQVLGCVVYCSTEIAAPGVVRHIEGTRFALGRLDGRSDARSEAIAAAFRNGGLKCSLEASIRDQVWLKAVGNVAFNPITTLTGARLGDLDTPEMVALLREVFAECAAVAADLGVVFPVSLERRLQAGIAVGDHKTSMLQDREAGKPLEIDCLTGAVIELADLVGRPVPHVRTLHACLKVLAAIRPPTSETAATEPALGA